MNEINEYDEDNNPCVEMLLPAETAKLILDHEPPTGSCARLRVYLAGPKKAIVATDTDLLTSEE